MAEPKCRDCGKPLKDPKYERCYECNQKYREQRGDSRPKSGLPTGYLSQGYFTDAGHLRDELVVDHARSVAEALHSHGITTGQIRRFYGHLRQVESRLTSGEPFEAVRPALLAMNPLVADAVGRARAEGKDMTVFKDFIERNVDLAARSQKDMQEGFRPHFMYVVAYFKYFNPKDGKGARDGDA